MHVHNFSRRPLFSNFMIWSNYFYLESRHCLAIFTDSNYWWIKNQLTCFKCTPQYYFLYTIENSEVLQCIKKNMRFLRLFQPVWCSMLLLSKFLSDLLSNFIGSAVSCCNGHFVRDFNWIALWVFYFQARIREAPAKPITSQRIFGEPSDRLAKNDPSSTDWSSHDSARIST